jgi:hypothetical protein
MTQEEEKQEQGPLVATVYRDMKLFLRVLASGAVCMASLIVAGDYRMANIVGNSYGILTWVSGVSLLGFVLLIPLVASLLLNRLKERKWVVPPILSLFLSFLWLLIFGAADGAASKAPG